MSSYNKYLIKDMLTNLTLYYLITISTSITSILTVFTTLISLSLYSFNNSFTSDLSDKRTEIDFFFEYDIFIVFIVFIVQDIFSIRLIFIFNFSIKSAFDILSNPLYLVNINLFESFIFFIFFLSTVFPFFYTVFYQFQFYSSIYIIVKIVAYSGPE